MNPADNSIYDPSGRTGVDDAARSGRPHMSVPNPKRSVPVNFLEMSHDDALSPFADESYVLGSSRSIKSPIMELNPTQDAARVHIQGNTGSKTPEIFELLGQTAQSAAQEQRPLSRGVIGSARKVKSSNSVLADEGGSGNSAPTGDSLFSLLGGPQSTPLPSVYGLSSGWDRAALGGQPLQSPLGRPSSTPAANNSSIYNHPFSSAGDGDGSSNPTSLSSSGALSGGLAGDLHLSSDASAVRGRNRDYSFGSLVGLAAQSQPAQVSGGPDLRSADILSEGLGAQLNPSSRGSSRTSSAHIFADVSAADTWLAGMTAGTTREQAIRGSLPLGGTVSAPPLLNMYSQGYNSINNHSAFGAQHSAVDRFDPLAARYGGGLGLPLSAIKEPAPASLLAPPAASVRTPSPAVAPSELASQGRNQQELGAGKKAGKSPEPETVEALVLRSCRDILRGAAERSLKAVELANTLRARVGTDALARIREKWGGLLSLLEKHTATFRVDRIPKNDKVTLLLGQGLDEAVVEGASTAGANELAGVRLGDPAQQQVWGAKPSFGLGGDAGGSAAGTSSGNSNSSATRCLHVGNVPANMTEPQLAREFEKFGQVENLKMVSQRNGARRFAFVTFQTVEQAVAARHALSKVHPWKSAISFAHKDFGNSQVTEGGGGRPGPPASVHPHGSSGGPAAGHGAYNSNASSGRTYTGAHDYPPNMLYQVPHQPQAPRMMMPTGAGIPYPYMHLGMGGMGMGMSAGMPYSAGAPMYWMPPPPPVAHAANAYPGPPPAMTLDDAQAGPSQQKPYQSALAGPSMERDCPVLRRLCDDTYVPTQPWPADPEKDQPYCAAVIAQLQQFSGCTTVSKLRGFLRNRISAVDNIKSVPLKALLVAYPQYFVLDGNYVYLSESAGTARYTS